MSASHDTGQALFAEIARQTKRLEEESYGVTKDAEALRHLAAAYRHVVGGPQPGGTAAAD